MNGEQTSGNSEWRHTTIREFVPFTYGKSLPTHERNTAGQVPVFGSNGIIGYHDSALTDGPTVIIGRKGTVGSIHYSDVPCWPIDTTFFFTDRDAELVKFKYYVLGTLGLNNMNTDSAVPGLNRSAAHARELWMPGKREQLYIAHILRTLDDKIELNRRMNRTLEEMARALFKSWFIDFDPVRAKIAGQKPCLPKDMWSLFPDSLVDSELGPIPEGWTVKALDEIADFQNGLALQKYRPHNNAHRLPVVKIAQLRSGKAGNGEWASDTIKPNCIINDGDVVFSWSGSLMVKIWCGGLAALNQHLFKVTSVEYPKWFFLYWLILHLPAFQDVAADKATTMGHIKREHLSEAKCIVPPKDNIIQIDRILSPLLSKYVSNDVQSHTLVAQRDILLPKLISGEIRMKITINKAGKS